jgi:ppGpp synthetase/RelA/SpoT-type nucleotidyltranferase
MSAEAELLQRWHEEKPLYAEWGEFIRLKVLELLVSCLGEAEATLFLRLPATPRTKGDASLVQKALYRKQYENPYDDVEDKVGIRFVVLTSEEISLVAQAIVGPGSEFWRAEKSRDFIAERNADPSHFGYQSDHYILRSKVGIVGPTGRAIPFDIPCEVQIRSILQHAYSEVTHDTIYKPSVKTTPEMMRAAAKAMALIEATDDYLRVVGKLVSESVKQVRDFVRDLRYLYKNYIEEEPIDTPLDAAIIDSLMPLIEGRAIGEIEAWLRSKPFIANKIRSHRAESSLFHLGGMLALYYCVGNFPNAAAEQEVLSHGELALIYSDLGQSIPQSFR